MFLDIALGLIAGWIIFVSTGSQDAGLLVFGVLSALAPDIDFILYLAKHRWKTDQFIHEHRDLLHKPLFVSVGGGALIALVNPWYGMVWLLGTLAHFIHDTFDGGWGILWLYPFSRGYFTLAAYSPKRYFQNREEQHEIASTHGNPSWLKDGYLKLNPKLIVEYLILGGVISGLIYWLFLQ